MSIDMEKIKSRLNSLTNPEGAGKSVFWRPQDGEQVIRIVPTADGDPFKDFFFHYNVGKNSGFLCPKKNFGDNCPVCSFVKTLFDDSDPDSIKMAKSLVARQRFFTPVIVRGEEAEGVRLWGFGKTAYQELLNLVLNPDYGDITDVTEGTDLVIAYGKPPGAQFPQTNITPRRKASRLAEDDETVNSWLENVPNFEELFEAKSSDEIKAILDEFLLSDEDAEGASSETTKYGSSNSGDTATSVDQAFSELLG